MNNSVLWLLFILMSGADAYLIYHFHKNEGWFDDCAKYSVFSAIFCTLAFFLAPEGATVRVFPIILFILTVTYFICDSAFYCAGVDREASEKAEEEGDEDEADAQDESSLGWRNLGIAVLIIALILSATVYSFRDSIYAAAKDVCRSSEIAEPATTDTETGIEEKKKDNGVDAFAISKLTAEEVNLLILEKYPNVSRELSFNSLSSTDAERTKTTGFSDALSFGFKSEDKHFEELMEEFFRNPPLLHTYATALRDEKMSGVRIGELCPDFDEFVELYDEYGLARFIERKANGEIDVTDEYRIYAAVMTTFFERARYAGVKKWTTAKNWTLNYARDNERGGVLAGYQYTGEFHVYEWVGKNGKVLFRIGVNLTDKRPAIPAVVTAVTPPSTKPNPSSYKKDPKETTDHSTGNPNTNNGTGPYTGGGEDPNVSTADDTPENPKDRVNSAEERAEIVQEQIESDEAQISDREPAKTDGKDAAETPKAVEKKDTGGTWEGLPGH